MSPPKRQRTEAEWSRKGRNSRLRSLRGVNYCEEESDQEISLETLKRVDSKYYFIKMIDQLRKRNPDACSSKKGAPRRRKRKLSEIQDESLKDENWVQITSKLMFPRIRYSRPFYVFMSRGWLSRRPTPQPVGGRIAKFRKFYDNMNLEERPGGLLKTEVRDYGQFVEKIVDETIGIQLPLEIAYLIGKFVYHHPKTDFAECKAFLNLNAMKFHALTNTLPKSTHGSDSQFMKFVLDYAKTKVKERDIFPTDMSKYEKSHPVPEVREPKKLEAKLRGLVLTKLRDHQLRELQWMTEIERRSENNEGFDIGIDHMKWLNSQQDVCQGQWDDNKHQKNDGSSPSTSSSAPGALDSDGSKPTGSVSDDEIAENPGKREAEEAEEAVPQSQPQGDQSMEWEWSNRNGKSEMKSPGKPTADAASSGVPSSSRTPNPKQPAGCKLLVDFAARAIYAPTKKTKQIFTTKGGVLADASGLGKSLSVISLIMSTLPRKRGRPARLATPQTFHTEATLVLCPYYLIPSWKSEFKNHAPKARVIVLVTISDLEKITYGDIIKADAVLLSTKLLMSRGYRILLFQAQSFHRLLRDNPLKYGSPLFEYFYWKRVVLDEGHQLLGEDSRPKVSGADRRFKRLEFLKRYHITLREHDKAYRLSGNMQNTIMEYIISFETHFRWFVSCIPFNNNNVSPRGILRFIGASINGHDLAESDKSRIQLQMALRSNHWHRAEEFTRFGPRFIGSFLNNCLGGIADKMLEKHFFCRFTSNENSKLSGSSSSSGSNTSRLTPCSLASSSVDDYSRKRIVRDADKVNITRHLF